MRSFFQLPLITYINTTYIITTYMLQTPARQKTFSKYQPDDLDEDEAYTIAEDKSRWHHVSMIVNHAYWKIKERTMYFYYRYPYWLQKL